MVSPSNVKNLVKILIGAAWIDGRIQPEERQYLPPGLMAESSQKNGNISAK